MIYVCEHHDEVLRIWRAEDRRDLRLAHVDFHDDLRGLLLNRAHGAAHPIGALSRGEAPVDPGNFLAHAVLERRVRQVRWFHDRVGGRAWDMGIVRYESDLFALPQRIRVRLRGDEGVPFRFEEQDMTAWSGVHEDEVLSIDWDCFASILQDAEGIDERVARFVEGLGNVRPAETYVVYSPEYCRPSVERFCELVERLSRTFDDTVHWNAPGLAEGRLHPTDVQAGLPQDAVSRLILRLRRLGLY